ncbi:MAG: integrase arm-type DNA-binding domain-containing protein [Pseudomonadota bacterium]
MTKLIDRQIAKLKKPGTYSDGNGLFLRVAFPKKDKETGRQVSEGGTKSWIFRYRLPHMEKGWTKQMGLGPYPALSLKAARMRAQELRELVLSNRDPMVVREVEKAARRAIPTFAECAAKFIAVKSSEWKNEKHKAQWPATLARYAYPVIGNLPVDQVTTDHVLLILEAETVDAATGDIGTFWDIKTETANRVRGRIEAVLNFAKVRKHRSGENPAALRGNLDTLLGAPKRIKARRREETGRSAHFAALPWIEISDFMTDLRLRKGMSARALEFTILTAVRSGETRNATWEEIDLSRRVWTIPAERMKAAKEHRVPLSNAAVAILEPLLLDGRQGLVFPNTKGRPLSDMALLAVIRRMGRGDVTTHGFRSTFRDWAGDNTAFPREVAEAALAHTIRDEAEAAYRRGDALEKRRKLMEVWANFCGKEDSAEPSVVPMVRRAN